MGKEFEFHFLEAPYVVLDEGDDEEQVDAWTRAAILASRAKALDNDKLYAEQGVEDEEEANRMQREIEEIQSELNETSEGKEVAKNSQHEDIEGLVARKTGRSLSRNWATSGRSGNGNVAGVQLALAQVGDYMRENGTVSERRSAGWNLMLKWSHSSMASLDARREESWVSGRDGIKVRDKPPY